MEQVTKEQVKEALTLLKTWAEQNKVNYFNAAYIKEGHSIVSMFYTVEGESRTNEDGSTNYNYYKKL